MAAVAYHTIWYVRNFQQKKSGVHSLLTRGLTSVTQAGLCCLGSVSRTSILFQLSSSELVARCVLMFSIEVKEESLALLPL